MKNGIFFFIIFLGLLLRLFRIDIPLLEFYPTRQVQTAEISRNFFYEDFNILAPQVNYLGPENKLFLIEFPIYNYAVSVIYLLIGNAHETIGRLLSILGWLLCAVLIYRIAKKYFGEVAALASTFFYSFSPLSVLVSRSFQPDQWMLTMSVSAVYFLDKWRESKKEIFFLISLLSFLLALLLKVNAAVFIAIPLFILLRRKGLLSLRTFVYFALSLLPSVLWNLYISSTISTLSGLQNDSGGYLQNVNQISIWFGPDLFFNLRYYLTLFGFENNLVLLPVGLVLFIVGFFTKLPKNSKVFYWWIGAILLYFLVFNKHNITHEYYHLPFLPIASIFVGWGCANIIKNLRAIIVSKSIIITIIFFLVFALMLSVTASRAYSPIDRFRDVKATADEIQNLTDPNDLIIGSMDAGPTLVYYAQRVGWVLDLADDNVSVQREVFGQVKKGNTAIEQLEQYRKKGAVLFASANFSQFKQNAAFADYMYKNYRVLVDNGRYVIFKLD